MLFTEHCVTLVQMYLSLMDILKVDQFNSVDYELHSWPFTLAVLASEGVEEECAILAQSVHC